MNYKKIYDICHSNGYMEEHETGAYIHILQMIEKLNLKFETVVDLGCSIGNGVNIFNNMGKRCKGLDISKVAVDMAKKRDLDVYEGSITNIPFLDKEFDVVISTDVLEHLIEEDLNKAIKEIFRISKKYVVLKIATRKETNSNDWLQELKKHNINLPNLHLSVFPSEKWKKYLINDEFVLMDEINHVAGFSVYAYKRK